MKADIFWSLVLLAVIVWCVFDAAHGKQVLFNATLAALNGWSLGLRTAAIVVRATE